MKKALAIILTLTLLLSMMAGCGSKKPAESTGPAPSGNQPGETGSSGSGSGSKGTLTIGIRTNAMVEDYETNAFTRWLEEETGYNLDFEYFAASLDDAKTQIAARASANQKLPDILWGFGLDTALYTSYGKDNFFLDLAPYFNDPELSKPFFDRKDEVSETDWNTMMRRITDTESGAIYVFPSLEYCEIDNMDYMMYINQTWLDKLNLKMPTNMDELYDVLVAFRDGDPNGNGVKDEIPLVGNNGKWSDVVNWIVNMFIYCNDEYWFNLDENGQLYLPFMTDAYRQALIYMNKLVSEGLLSPLTLSIGSSELKSLVNPKDGVPTVGIFGGHMSLIAETDNEALLQYEAMPYWGRTILTEQIINRGVFVSADCADPDGAWEVLMAMWSKDGSMRMRYGEYGVDWTDADPGSKSYLGYDAEYKLINQNTLGAAGNQLWNVIYGTMLVYAEGENSQQDENASEWAKHKLAILRDCHDNYYAAAEKNDPKLICPNIVHTTAENEEISAVRSNCQTYINSSRQQFILGTMDPNSDTAWNNYLNELKTMGVEQWL